MGEIGSGLTLWEGGRERNMGEPVSENERPELTLQDFKNAFGSRGAGTCLLETSTDWVCSIREIFRVLTKVYPTGIADQFLEI